MSSNADGSHNVTKMQITFLISIGTVAGLLLGGGMWLGSLQTKVEEHQQLGAHKAANDIMHSNQLTIAQQQELMASLRVQASRIEAKVDRINEIVTDLRIERARRGSLQQDKGTKTR